MTIQTLPTRTDVPRYDFEIELDGVVYVFDMEWNDRDSGWYMSILDRDLTPLLSGRRVVTNWPLTNRYRDSRLPAGTIEAVDTSGSETEPGLSDLGDRVKLIYTPKADL